MALLNINQYYQAFFITIIVWLGLGSGAREGEVQKYLYTQPLDHFVFNSGAPTFQQRVFIDLSYRPDGVIDGVPILVFFGGESNIENFVYIGGGGVVSRVASKFRAIVVYIEHRFYGNSVPFGSIYRAMLDPEVRACLASHQALADYASVIESVKSNLSLHNSSVIVFGGSYAGMLAAWFRLKYPHLANGALASSAPILSSIDLPVTNQYCTIVSRDFEDESGRCYEYISRSWSLIDKAAARPGGLETLSKSFHVCSPLFSGYQLKHYLALVYSYMAQFNGRFGQIHGFCEQVSQTPEDKILEGIGAAVLKLTELGCTDISFMDPVSFRVLDENSTVAWNWQICSELIPHDGCSEFTMFERRPFNLSLFREGCFQKYGVNPNPYWISTYYGGEDIKLALKTSAANIIFSNGLMDPLSGAGILEDMSKTVVALTTGKGSHCLDMSPAKKDDPTWLKHQREREFEIISHWISSSGRSIPIKFLWASLLAVVVYLV